MTRKFDYIPFIPNYEWIREQMKADLEYRLKNRLYKTSLGRPLYERINIQLITTQECPYNCPFCLERQNPMEGNQDLKKQIESLKGVLSEHPNARLTITGGEPGLYTDHVVALVDTFKQHSKNIFISVNTSGYDPAIAYIPGVNINLSINDYVKPEILLFPHSTYQTVLSDSKMNLVYIKNIMDTEECGKFSFRFMSSLKKHNYDITIWNELQKDQEIQIKTFRIGDFFVYATFDYHGKHARVTLGDMYQQINNNYQDGYSNIIIHPDGKVKTNWK